MSLGCDLGLDLDPEDGLRFRFTVRNTGDEPIELQFRNGRTADFALYEDGTERWRWSDGRLFTQALHSQRLDSGGTATYGGVWEYPEPGSYTAVATLAATDHDCTAERECSVPAGEGLSSDRS